MKNGRKAHLPTLEVVKKQEAEKLPELVNIVILGKFADGKIRQIIANKFIQMQVLNAISVLSDKGIQAIEIPISNVGWTDNVDLRVKG